MALEDYLVPIGRNTNICFDCKKACGGCSWSRNFEPVPGWTAKPTIVKAERRKYQETYRITGCPEFEPDERSRNE